MSAYDVVLHWDGGSAPTNPGPSAGAYVLQRGQTLLAEGGVFLPHATNNQAEYTGLIAGLEKARELGLCALTIQGDSLLMVNQLNGVWRVRNEKLKELFDQTRALLVGVEHTIQHVRREYNQHADRLADFTIQKRESWCSVSM
jgi:ribonuclease HI